MSITMVIYDNGVSSKVDISQHCRKILLNLRLPVSLTLLVFGISFF